MTCPCLARATTFLVTKAPRRFYEDAIAFQRQGFAKHARSLTVTSCSRHQASSYRRSTYTSAATDTINDDQWIPFDLPQSTDASQDPIPGQSLPAPFTPPPPPSITFNDALQEIGYLEDDTSDIHNDSPPNEPEIALQQQFASLSSKQSQEDPNARTPQITSSHVAPQRVKIQKDIKKAKVDTKRVKTESTVLYQKPPIKGRIFAEQQKKSASASSTDVFGNEAKDHKFNKFQPISKAESRKREQWQIQKGALQQKFGEEHWNPRKRLSPDALDGIRAMHAQYPDHFTTPVLAAHFKVSPEAIRRILKSKWRPSIEEEQDRRARWDKRGEKIWTSLVEKGIHAPKKWRDMGIGKGPRKAPSILFPAPLSTGKRPKSKKSSPSKSTSI